MSDVTMTRAEYEALLTWAKLGAEEAGQGAALLERRRAIDLANGLRRYTLVLRWESLPQRLVGASLRGTLVSTDTKTLELSRKPTPNDVLESMAGINFMPGSLLVTADPQGEVGWYEIEKFPWD